MGLFCSQGGNGLASQSLKMGLSSHIRVTSLGNILAAIPLSQRDALCCALPTQTHDLSSIYLPNGLVRDSRLCSYLLHGRSVLGPTTLNVAVQHQQ